MEFRPDTPIYLQLAEAIEDDILRGLYAEESQIPSTTELSVTLKINPATSNKGVNLLVDEGILYKKRGVGMFVSTGARERITQKRKEAFYENYILTLLEEARKLGIGREELIALIQRGNKL